MFRGGEGFRAGKGPRPGERFRALVAVWDWGSCKYFWNMGNKHVTYENILEKLANLAELTFCKVVCLF